MTVEEEIHLFNSDQFISPQVQTELPPDYIIRSLKRNDDEYGFVELLSQLSVIGNITPESYKSMKYLSFTTYN
jgi:hypothetical protein